MADTVPVDNDRADTGPAEDVGLAADSVQVDSFPEDSVLLADNMVCPVNKRNISIKPIVTDMA